MSKEGILRLRGEVIEALPNTLFRVDVPQLPQPVLSTLSGKMRRHRIRVVPGDWVELELTPYNLERGRVATRLSPDEAAQLRKQRVTSTPPQSTTETE